LLWKARQVADQHGSGAVAVRGWWSWEQETRKRKALVDFVVHDLKGDLFPELMGYMGAAGGPQAEVGSGRDCPQGVADPEAIIPVPKGRVGVIGWALSVAAAFACHVTVVSEQGHICDWISHKASYSPFEAGHWALGDARVAMYV
jgi:hypothetical protein